MDHQYDGYITIPHNTYDAFRNWTINNGFNVDGYAGNQCWDYLALLWYQYGLTLYTGPEGFAYECWTVSRNANASGPFIQITNYADVKRGDVLVMGPVSGYPAGHIAFADEDYNGTDYMYIVGQHQGESSSAATSFVNRRNWNVGTRFLGAFRNNNWTAPSPTPTETKKKKKFPYPVAWQHWENFKRP